MKRKESRARGEWHEARGKKFLLVTPLASSPLPLA